MRPGCSAALRRLAHATNPVNALLNYSYACLEAESRLALLAHGMDPTIGVLHADQRNRDSFALDAMEPVRPDVDAFILDLLEDRVFASRDFAELPNGVCRIGASITHDLALALPQWRLRMAPIAVRLAKAFRDALTGKRENGAVPAPKRSALVNTPRKAPQARPYAGKTWSAPRPEALAAAPGACELCGAPVLKRRRRHCEACMPQARRKHGLRAIAKARDALAAQTAAGHDPRRSLGSNRARCEAIGEGHRRNRSWAREHPGQRDDAWFKHEIAPKLDGFSLAEIAAATGLSLAACSRIRAGARVPHPRHWQALATLARA